MAAAQHGYRQTVRLQRACMARRIYTQCQTAGDRETAAGQVTGELESGTTPCARRFARAHHRELQRAQYLGVAAHV